MFNVKKSSTGMFMLGMSMNSRSMAEKWLGYYEKNYPQFKFEIVDNAPEVTCDIPDLTHLLKQ